jgi:hypothetical protein
MRFHCGDGVMISDSEVCICENKMLAVYIALLKLHLTILSRSFYSCYSQTLSDSSDMEDR